MTNKLKHVITRNLIIVFKSSVYSVRQKKYPLKLFAIF